VALETQRSIKEDFLIHQKEMEMAALLEVTTAINRNVSSEDLFKIYGFMLQAHLAVSKVVVMYKLGSEWMCVLDQGVDKALANEIKPKEDFASFSEAGPLINTTLSYEHHFDYFIPVSHKEEPLAYVLLGDDKTEKRDWPDQKKFMQAFTNIVIVAAENKRLFKRQLEQERLGKEIEVARQVQTSLIPETLPKTDKLELDSVYLPHSGRCFWQRCRRINNDVQLSGTTTCLCGAGNRFKKVGKETQCRCSENYQR